MVDFPKLSEFEIYGAFTLLIPNLEQTAIEIIEAPNGTNEVLLVPDLHARLWFQRAARPYLQLANENSSLCE